MTAVPPEMLETLLSTGRTGVEQKEIAGIRQYIEDTIGLEEMYKLEMETVGGRKVP